MNAQLHRAFRTTIIAAASAFAMAAPAYATGSAGQADQAKAAPTGKDGKGAQGDRTRICKLAESTGSRMVSRTCRTKAEWDRIERDGY